MDCPTLSVSNLPNFRTSALLLLFLALLLFPPVAQFPLVPPLYASDEPFTSPANWGGTGLMEIPTARVMRPDSYRLGFSQTDPYRYYYGTVSPVQGLELNLRITEVRGVPAFDPPTGNFRDKAFDLKYQLIAEGKYVPALSVGFMDPHGTRIYPSQYLVMSKQIYPFDLTIGFGNGRFGRGILAGQGEGIQIEMFEDPGEWLRDSRFFGGIEYALSEKLALKAEYSPVRYHKQTRDPAQPEYFNEPVSSKLNISIRFKPTQWSELALSYQRGEEIGFQVTTAFDIGKPLLPLYDQTHQEEVSSGVSTYIGRIIHSLYRAGFSDILVRAEGDTLHIEAQNEKYYYTPAALGVILHRADEAAPDSIRRYSILLSENRIPQVLFVTAREDFRDFIWEKLSAGEFLSLSDVRTEIAVSETSGMFRKAFRYGIKPQLETFLNDRSGFFKYRLGITGWVDYYPWKGGTIASAVGSYPLNNISTAAEPLSIPVRSDIALYKKEKIALNRLLFDQIFKAANEVYGKVSAGLLEVEYTGVDAEIARPVLGGRILLGVSGSLTKKREPDAPFALETNEVKDVYSTAFFNARLNIPEQGIAVDIKAGRFLAGDTGVRFTVSRFINGVVLSAWYTVTDTTDFTDDHNSGYSDKGISIAIPLRLFAGTDTRTVYNYSLTPWTRDTGQDIEHFGSLFDIIGRNLKIFIDKDRHMFYR